MSNTLQKKFNQLKPYVVQIRFPDELSVVDTIFPEGWTVPTSKHIKVGKSEESVNYHMFYSENPAITIDDIMNFIEETIRINIEREKKYELLKAKVQELKIFFNNNPLNKLQNMKFVLGDVNLLPEKLTEDILNSEFDLDMDDDIPVATSIEEPAPEINNPEVIAETDPDYDVQQFNNRFRHQDIELPPKKGNKVEVEVFEVPVGDGPCTHDPDQFCPKCMDQMDL